MSSVKQNVLSGKQAIHLLSVGLPQQLDAAYARILLGRPCNVTEVANLVAPDATEAEGASCDVAVLGGTLPKEKLAAAARTIRRRWPKACILVVSATPLKIDDALYDDRILPIYSTKVLVAEVLRLMESHRPQRGDKTTQWEC